MELKLKDHLKRLCDEYGSIPISRDTMQKLNRQFQEDMQPVIKDLRQKELESFEHASKTFLTRVFHAVNEQAIKIGPFVCDGWYSRDSIDLGLCEKCGKSYDSHK